MAIFTKEDDALTPNAGLGIIDQILNKFSKHAVSNKAVSEEFERLREEIANMGMEIPDLTNRITVTTSMHNPPENGFMEIIDTPGKGTQCFINGADYHRSIFGFVPVTPDDVLTYGQYYNNVCYFYPVRRFQKG